ncbi:hypothetical protein C0991_012566 [Blastosporella zonata]|nr:hypothetical protein C0991_012566 [Blastosporella zonata]
MGKGKKLKAPKTYTADAKYLVVVDPWPRDSAHPWFINNVAAWFEKMIKDEYPDERHSNIIVELAEWVDVQPYIGKHAHTRFLRGKFENTDAISYIYEYDYEKQNDPARRNWTARYPGEYDLNVFPFKENYPLPEPAPPPPPHVGYVKRPRNVPTPTSAAVVDHQFQSPDVPARASREPTPPPTHEEREAERVTQKRDPYEEDDDAVRLFRSVTRDLVPKQEQDVDYGDSVREKSMNDDHLLTKRERENSAMLDAVDSFLDSVPIKKEERMVPVPFKNEPRCPEGDVFMVPYTFIHILTGDVPTEDDYKPSAELLAAIARMPIEASISGHVVAGRDRSTTLATDFGEPGGPLTMRIKPEPKEEDMLPPPPPPPQWTLDPKRKRSTTLGDRDALVKVNPELQDAHVIPAFDPRARAGGKAESPRVKPEPRNDVVVPQIRNSHPRFSGRGEASGPSGNGAPPPLAQTRDPRIPLARRGDEAVYVKPEPQDHHTLPPTPVTRDPRLARRAAADKRRVDGESDTGKCMLF